MSGDVSICVRQHVCLCYVMCPFASNDVSVSDDIFV